MISEPITENDGPVLYVIGTYPLLTTTFIDREIGALRSAGVEVEVTSIRRPEGLLNDEQRAALSAVRYILPVSKTALVGHVLRFSLKAPSSTVRLLVRLVTGDHPNARARLKTIGHFILGIHIAGVVQSLQPRHVHAHFIDRAATVGMVVSTLLNIPFTATAHANDIYVNPVLLSEKLTAARSVATCTGHNLEHLSRVVPDGNVRLIHHGLDLASYQPGQQVDTGSVRIVGVGQLKEKKGFRYLIEACRQLREGGYDLSCGIIGEGPLREALSAQIHEAGLDDHVQLLGAMAHEGVVEHLKMAAIFALPCVTAGDGDTDGIPNVILEAMATSLPVVSTQHSGIPEAVEDGVTGLLAAPGDVAQLVAALKTLLDDPEMRSAMGKAGRLAVERSFDVRINANRLVTEVIR